MATQRPDASTLVASRVGSVDFNPLYGVRFIALNVASRVGSVDFNI